jgi:hypothetical protein
MLFNNQSIGQPVRSISSKYIGRIGKVYVIDDIVENKCLIRFEGIKKGYYDFNEVVLVDKIVEQQLLS